MAVWGIARGIDPWYMVIGVVVLVAACASLFTHVASWRKPKPQSSVYLDSLRPSVCQRLDRPDTQRWIGGERLAHALNAHPVEGSPGRFWSSYEFRLPEGCHHLCMDSALDLLDQLRPHSPAVFHLQDAIDCIDFFRLPEHAFPDHIVLVQPTCHFAPIPERRLVADFARWRWEPARAASPANVLVYELARPANLASDVGLRDQAAVIHSEHVSANLRLAHVVDGV